MTGRKENGMNPRITPVKRKIIAAIIIDSFLFLILLLAVYSFFFIPARAENVDWLTDTSVPRQTSNPDLNADRPFNGGPTDTLEPNATDTLEPSPTDSLKPSATNTLEPSPTNTLAPSATNTLEPSPTNTLEPSATNTLEPSPTNTLEPSSTNTPITPSPTNTTEPSASPTLKPTNTQTSTIEPLQTPSPTYTPPSNTNTPKPSQRYILSTPTPSNTSTPVAITCADCYIVKDFRELIVSGLYTADLLNTEDISSTFKVTITLYDVYKGVVVGNAIDMVDTQPANEVMNVETPLWCISPIKGVVYWIHTEASAQKSTGEIWFVMDEWVRINLLESMTK
jgi:hypothetical protein